MSNLAWLLYVTDTILGGIIPLFCAFTFVILIIITLHIIYCMICGEKNVVNKKYAITLLIVFVLLSLVPSKNTVYKMIAANGITDVYKNEGTQKLIAKGVDTQKLVAEGFDILKLTLDNYKKQLEGKK